MPLTSPWPALGVLFLFSPGLGLSCLHCLSPPAPGPSGAPGPLLLLLPPSFLSSPYFSECLVSPIRARPGCHLRQRPQGYGGGGSFEMELPVFWLVSGSINNAEESGHLLVPGETNLWEINWFGGVLTRLSPSQMSEWMVILTQPPGP